MYELVPSVQYTRDYVKLDARARRLVHHLLEALQLNPTHGDPTIILISKTNRDATYRVRFPGGHIYYSIQHEQKELLLQRLNILKRSLINSSGGPAKTPFI